MTTYNHITAGLCEGGTVLELCLLSPKGNVLSMAMMHELQAALTAHRDTTAMKAVLLRAEGRHFSYGASVAEHTRDRAADMLECFHDLVRELAGYPVPIVAMVQGRCLGGAFEVVMCAHVVLAMRGAVFACPEITLGVFPPVLAAIGHLRLGGALSERLLLTGAELHADAAKQCGFVAQVFADHGEDEAPADPRELGMQWIRQHFGDRSAFALRQATKAARYASGLRVQVEGALHAVEKQYVDELLPSHDGNEGIDAFLQHRPPVWRHR